ncbi:MAG: hypothetical protein KBE22_03195 [Candidatus Accumulibacter sp.]|nr:hypothetical protein [Accumulibacter sp.]
MPVAYINTYPVDGWNSETFTGPLTGGSSGFLNSLGVTFQPTGAVEGDSGNWLTGWRPTANISVTVSCSPNAGVTSGSISWIKWDDTRLGTQTIDLSGGGPVTVSLSYTAVNADIRGINVRSGDTSTAHDFTLASTVGAGVQVTLPLSINVLPSGKATLPMQVTVSSPAALNTSAGAARWSPAVSIGGVDVSARITGRMSVQASEDASRLATLEMVAQSSAQLAGLENSPVTIDLALTNSLGTVVQRVFTGIVETWEFNPAVRTVSLSCRDGWHERPAACTSAADVEALLGGMAAKAPLLIDWNSSEPDPAGYFSGLLETVPGATCVDASGLWRVIPWNIGSPQASFTAGDIIDESLAVNIVRRADLPGKVSAVLNHRHPRLHQAELDLYWFRVAFSDFILYGFPWLMQHTAQGTFEKLGEWHIKGNAGIKPPAAGTYMVNIGGNAVPYIIQEGVAETLVEEINVTLYRRWYQEVETTYTYDITISGGSGRDQELSASIKSEFDSQEWETLPTSEQSIALFSANGPAPVVTPTGYEGLPLPHPAKNTAIDYWGTVAQSDLGASGEHLLAKAVRTVAKALRSTTVKFSRPLDLRFDLGAVLSVSAYDVVATGQVIDLSLDLELSSGNATATYTLAVPDSVSSTTASSATLTAPANTVAHALTKPVLGNHIGARLDTPSTFVEDDLQGFLFNTSVVGNDYSASKPAFVEQFRVVMPEVDAIHRDGLNQAGSVSASWSIAGGSMTITF